MFAAQRGQTIREKKTEETEKKAERPLEKTLEEEAERFKITENDKEQQKQYIHNLNTIELDKKRENLYNLAKYDGLDNQQQELYRDVQKEFYDRRKAFQEGEYKPMSKRARELLSIDTSQYIR